MSHPTDQEFIPADDGFIPITPPASPLKPQSESFFERKMREAGIDKSAAEGRKAPGILDIIGQRIKQDWPQFLGMAATTPIGGGGLLGPIKRMLTGGAVDTAGEFVRGTPPKEAAKEGLKFMAGQGAGEAGMGVLRGALNPVFKTAFDSRTAAQLATHLKATVPAWNDFPQDMRGLYDMIYSPRGYTRLHEMADQSFQGVLLRAKGVEGAMMPEINIPESVARALKIRIQGPSLLPDEGGGPLNPEASVLAVDAAKAALGQWRKHPGEYRAVMDALDAAGIGDPRIRTAYKTAMGAKDYLDQTKAFEGTQFKTDKAQEGLSSLKDVESHLHRRNLPELFNIIKGPLPDTIKPINQNPWTRKLYGGLAGEVVATPLGLPRGVGATVGAAAGEMFLPRFSNVPTPPGAKIPFNLGASAVNDLVRALSPDLLESPPPLQAEEEEGSEPH